MINAALGQSSQNRPEERDYVKAPWETSLAPPWETLSCAGSRTRRRENQTTVWPGSRAEQPALAAAPTQGQGLGFPTPPPSSDRSGLAWPRDWGGEGGSPGERGDRKAAHVLEGHLCGSYSPKSSAPCGLCLRKVRRRYASPPTASTGAVVSKQPFQDALWTGSGQRRKHAARQSRGSSTSAPPLHTARFRNQRRLWRGGSTRAASPALWGSAPSFISQDIAICETEVFRFVCACLRNSSICRKSSVGNSPLGKAKPLVISQHLCPWTISRGLPVPVNGHCVLLAKVKTQ